MFCKYEQYKFFYYSIKVKKTTLKWSKGEEVLAGFEPAIKVLQTHALPLGYITMINYMKYICRVSRLCAHQILLFFSHRCKLSLGKISGLPHHIYKSLWKRDAIPPSVHNILLTPLLTFASSSPPITIHKRTKPRNIKEK
jgi:hypothetical protein